MQELLEQLYEYLSGIWRYRWVALIAAWVVAIAGWVFVAQLPDKFMATARLHVDSNSVLRPLLRGLAIQPDVGQRVALMSKTLLSRPNMEKLMRMVDLDLKVRNDSDKEGIITELRDNVGLSGDSRNASLYSISYTHSDRLIAQRVVQSLISIFIESTLGDKRKDSAGAQEFLDKQIAEYEVRLAEAEGRLADFKRRYVGTMPGEQGGYYQRLEMARGLLSGAELELREAENRRNELKRQLAGEEPVFIPSGTEEFGVESKLDQRIQNLQTRMDDLLLKYTDKHPDVIELKAIIADLEKEREEELATRSEAQMASPQQGLQSSPVYQQMRSMLAESEARAAELRVRAAEYKKRVEEIEGKVDQIPLIEAELQQLNRDYQAVSEQHQQLLSRRESAHLSEKAEQDASEVKFRVIDPPFVPLKPTEPNKLLLNAVVFVAGLGAGIGLALLISIIRPVFYSRGALNRITGLPVLGSVTLITSAMQTRKERMAGAMFFSMILLLATAFIGVSLMQDLGIDLVDKLQSLRAKIL
ncbi:XrtA system polysaccharide chain length determinant [Sedimenticola selenatireducens]|uniref:Chain length-determining protein n=1 Tax=Sedimenticola selenatireducens TaxID=191960 RepID=A0A557S830_9GAMM|nr:XrtA system polysaccharide chain length determinant [Sedimenticola selenatireducens]TVO73570.1 chain length-determining protein [Sedimenticola selenatireducens]TVT63510.1 MAG: chain length-determining protein [Sedimenticola selenatireducens]